MWPAIILAARLPAILTAGAEDAPERSSSFHADLASIADLLSVTLPPSTGWIQREGIE